MSLQKDRTRSSVKGLGTLSVRETSPSAGTTFDEVGGLDGETGTVLEDFSDLEEIVAETGNLEDVKEKSRVTRLSTNLLQTSIDEINLNKQSTAKTHALRYYGMHSPGRFQYFCIPKGRINPGVALGFRSGKRVLPLRAWALKQSDLAFDYPEYLMAETKGLIRIKDLQLWINPRDIYAPEAGTAKVFDISGWERHGDLNSDYATIWQTGTPDRFLRFDGVNDFCDFGNILSINATDNMMFEVWVKVLAANATEVPFIDKANATLVKGYHFQRNSLNNVSITLKDNINPDVTAASATTLLQNIWAHLVFVVDRGNQTLKLYRNAVADGAPASLTSMGDTTTTDPFKIAVFGSATLYGNFETGGFRIYNFGAGGLPSDIATIILNHYNAEKSYFGL